MRRLLVLLGVCCTAPVLTAAPVPPEGPPKLLVVSSRAGKPAIYVMSLDGTGAIDLTRSKSVNSYPAWSPDRRKIAFVSDRDGTLNVYAMNADGSDVRQLTKGEEMARVPSWSPDGKKIAFCRRTPVGERLFVMDADGGNAKQVGDGDVWDPAWSPDGKKILFATFRSGRGYRLYVMDAAGGNVKELTSNDNPIGFVYPAWAPDGKRIAWADRVGTAIELFVADADGQHSKQITRLGGINCYPAWSPDGKQIVFHHHEDNQSGIYYIMDAEGNNMKELLKDEPPVEGGRPVWQPRAR